MGTISYRPHVTGLVVKSSCCFMNNEEIARDELRLDGGGEKIKIRVLPPLILTLCLLLGASIFKFAQTEQARVTEAGESTRQRVEDLLSQNCSSSYKLLCDRSLSQEQWKDELDGFLAQESTFENIAKEVKQVINVDLVLAVDKNWVERQQWAKISESGQSNKEKVPNYIVLGKALEVIPEAEAIDQYFNKSTNLPEKYLEFPGGNKIFQILAIPFGPSSDQRAVSYIVILKDISKVVISTRQSILMMSSLSVFVGTALVIFFYKLLAQVEQDLVERRKNLLKLKTN